MHFLNGARVRVNEKKLFYFLKDDIFLFWHDFEPYYFLSDVLKNRFITWNRQFLTTFFYYYDL